MINTFSLVVHLSSFLLLCFARPRLYLPVCVFQVKKKINGSFSGGQETKELQELHGANINVSPKFKHKFVLTTYIAFGAIHTSLVRIGTN